MTGIQQQKTARAISVFGFPLIKAGLTHQGGLLITQSTANRYAGPQRSVFQGYPQVLLSLEGTMRGKICRGMPNI